MVEAALVSLMKLYALIAEKEKSISYDFACDFIYVMLNKELMILDYKKYLDVFTQNYAGVNGSIDTESEERLKVLCNQLIKELPKKQRLIVYLYLLKFLKFFHRNPISIPEQNSTLDHIITQIGIFFRINIRDRESLKAFINQELHAISNKQNLILIGRELQFNEITHIKNNELSGILVFYYIESLKQFIFYLKGSDELVLNNVNIIPYAVYFFIKSSSIQNKNSFTLYYNNLLKALLEKNKIQKFFISANDLEYKFGKSDTGIHPFNFYAESGQFIGILGKSGSGKTTLMKLLSGQLIPQKGEVILNNSSFRSNWKSIRSDIGYMPQNDTLISELTAYQNLYYYAKLWDNSLKDEEIDSKIEELLVELELDRIKDRVIGTRQTKIISGGERQRLNLALELIKKPKVLFADEPTSGLSSSDAETIIKFLHEQVLKGCVVIINIHQPSDEIFNIFDKVIILDTGGYPVFIGNPSQAANTLNRYQKKLSQNPHEVKNYSISNSETIFQILEDKRVNEFGEYTHERKILPNEWYHYFKKREQQDQHSEIKQKTHITDKRGNQSALYQWLVYIRRNLLMKKSDKQYMVVTLLTSPLLGFVIAFLCKKNELNTLDYSYMDNPNIPSFIFMSVIVALFTGLLTSAEEIYKDRSILLRESFLHTYTNSYLLSKICLMFFISGIQMFFYVYVATHILQIRGMVFSYWVILFSLSCTANVIGLILSGLFKSAVTIYIFIPFILIPQILLSGVVIKFDDLNPKISSPKFTPFPADIMPARWAYEALAVYQFKNNKYQEMIFDIEKKISNNAYKVFYLGQDINSQINNLIRKIQAGKRIEQEDFNLLLKGLSAFDIKRITYQEVKVLSRHDLYKWLQFWQTELKLEFDRLRNEIKQLQYEKKQILTEENTVEKNKYYNSILADLLRNVNEIKPYLKYKGEYIRLSEPVYNPPDSKFARAHLYASTKSIANYTIDTYWFDLLIIWLMTLLMYFMLYIVFIRYNISNQQTRTLK